VVWLGWVLALSRDVRAKSRSGLVTCCWGVVKSSAVVGVARSFEVAVWCSDVVFEFR
jgi:hypothetical protein